METHGISSERLAALDTFFTALEAAAEGSYVFLCDMQNSYSRWSRRAVEHFGMPGCYMLNAGDVWEEHVHPDDRANYHERVAAVFAGQEDSLDLQYRARNALGSYSSCSGHAIVVKDEQGQPLYLAGSIRDKGAADCVDTLTGLENHYALFGLLDDYFEEGVEARMMMVGISRFSTINEMWGYGFGNIVIRKVADILRSEFRDEGRLYRVDGVRFVLLTSSIALEELPARYERLRQRISDEVVVNDYRPHLGIFGSVVEIDDFSVEPMTVYPCLEYSASASKEHHGGDLQLFTAEVGGGQDNLLGVLNAVRRSIETDCGGFSLHFQPIIGAQGGELCGAEALLRWHSPEHGTVPPGRFIPIIENDPIFVRLGEWIMRTAMENALPLVAAHPDFELSINLSYKQLQQGNFVSMVERLLDETGYPGRNLCLEITERCRLLDKERLAAIFAQLQARGVRFAIDDFGTGYSSLEILNSLNFDVVKVDKSFVDSIVDDAKSARFVTTMSDLATACGASTCAEGVETAQQCDAVRSCGIDCIQGYYYAKPMPLDAFMATYA